MKMALFECPECGKMISERARKCPKCGYILQRDIEQSYSPEIKTTSSETKKKNHNKRLKGQLIINAAAPRTLFNKVTVTIENEEVAVIREKEKVIIPITRECEVVFKWRGAFSSKTIFACPNEIKVVRLTYGSMNLNLKEDVYYRDGVKLMDAPKGGNSFNAQGLMRGALGIASLLLGGEATADDADFDVDDYGDDIEPYEFASDGDGMIDSVGIDTDGDGMIDSVGIDTDGNGMIDSVGIDTDGDGMIDSVGIDTDGDGMIDSVGIDTDGDGMIDSVGIDTDGDGMIDSVGIDTDGDGMIDSVGVDTDGDGMIDSVGIDTDGDGMIDSVGVDTDGDGMIDSVGVDTDGNGRVDTIYIDSDRDGSIDTIREDTDGDGVIDTISYDKDGDGIFDEVINRDDEKLPVVQLAAATAMAGLAAMPQLMKCPECGKMISKRAKACPKCGYKLLKVDNAINSDSSNSDKSETKLYKVVISCIMVVILFVVFFLIKMQEKGAAPSGTESYSTEITNDANHSWNETDRSSISSDEGSVSSTSVFRHAQDVVSYLSSHSFSKGSNTITFRDMCLYTNGRCATGAINVVDFNETQAVLQAYSPLSGGYVNFKVDKISGKLTDLSTGDVYN